MAYTPETLANWNIAQTVKHMLNQGIDAATIRDALHKQADDLQQWDGMTRPGNVTHET